MRKSVLLLAGLLLLYLAPALVLKASYGESYSLWAGEDYWIPGENGSWIKLGLPTDPMPSEPSIKIPTFYRYIPIFLPAALLILFLFTPLRKHLEGERSPEESNELDQLTDDSASETDDG